MRWPVVLASASPRRHHLLRELVSDFEILVADLDEDALTLPDPFATAESLALAKARAIATGRPDALVIGADTVVALATDDRGEYQQLTKPTDEADAVRILTALQGRTHLVITGIALVYPGGEISAHDVTRVTFKPTTEVEIRAYIKTGEPMDKAGAYGLQGGGQNLVAHVDGSRSNVVGLPLELLASRLALLGE